MYFLSDYILFPILYYIIRYRRTMVEKNLRLSFPEKSDKERQVIMKAFYHRLSDIVVEVIYGCFASEATMRKRVVFHNVESVAQDALEHGGLIFMLGHMGNWDWIAEIHREVAPYGLTECNVYRKQKSKFFDQLLLKIRAKRGGFCADKNTLLRTMVKERAAGHKITYGLICDQKPSPRNAHYWTTFLNQETSFLDGGEILGKKFNFPCYYARITSPKRGYYDIDLQAIASNPKDTPEWSITEEFARRLEANIQAQPEIWLWTHNRWKWGRESAHGAS